MSSKNRVPEVSQLTSFNYFNSVNSICFKLDSFSGLLFLYSDDETAKRIFWHDDYWSCVRKDFVDVMHYYQAGSHLWPPGFLHCGWIPVDLWLPNYDEINHNVGQENLVRFSKSVHQMF